MIVGGFFYGRVNNDRFRQQELQAVVKRAQGKPSGYTDGAYLDQVRERTEDRALAFLSAGGVLVLVGAALKLTARKREDAGTTDTSPTTILP